MPDLIRVVAKHRFIWLRINTSRHHLSPDLWFINVCGDVQWGLSLREANAP
jgi:hypothetical protein